MTYMTFPVLSSTRNAASDSTQMDSSVAGGGDHSEEADETSPIKACVVWTHCLGNDKRHRIVFGTDVVVAYGDSPSR